MEANQTTITELESDLIQSFVESDTMYVYHLLEYTKAVTSREISGVTCSLVKKGLVSTFEDEYGKGMALTPQGLEIEAQLEAQTTC